MVANPLGRNIYTFHAFIAPWVGVFKMFFPYSENTIRGLLPRLVDFADNAMGKLTNIFWNIRQVGKAVVAYDGTVKSNVLADKQNDVQKVVSFYWEQYVKKYISLFYRSVFKSNDLSSNTNFNYIVTDETKQKIKNLRSEMWNNYLKNFDSIRAKAFNKEPQNQQWYVRMKILSKCLGLPAGSLGTVLNGLGIGLNFIGSVFNVKRLTTLSDKCTDWANGLMALVYLTGEVPANLNEYKKATNGIKDPRNLAVFSVGVLGMLNRIKVLPIFSKILDVIKIKPLLDKFDKSLRHFFYLFFSYNRLVFHSIEKAAEKEKASNKDLDESRMHENLWSHLTLPIRVLMADDQVSYSLKPESEVNEQEQEQTFAEAA